MRGPTRRALTALGLITLLTPGCLSVLNPVPDPLAEARQACDSLPITSRHQVYVVLVNGADPLCCGNLQGVREYLGTLGFVKSYHAQLYHEACLIKELRDVQAEHPDARFAVVGFEYGALPARNLARRAAEEGLPIDLLVYLQPKGLKPDAGFTTSAIRRLITIHAGSGDLLQANLQMGETVNVPCISRYGVPTHPDTLAVLATELTHLAASIPVIAPVVEPFPSVLDDPAPTPRPIIIQPTSKTDDWDFLKPLSKRQEKTPPRPASTIDLASTVHNDFTNKSAIFVEAP